LYIGATFTLPPAPSTFDLQNALNEMSWSSDDEKSRVLVVDDDEVLTNFVSSILIGSGMVVQSLNAPIRIMHKMEQFEPNLVILDVMMPGLSGYDVCRLLRENSRWEKVSIIFLTSRSDPAGRTAAFTAGGNDFLSKPVLSEELIARVKAQLDHAGHKTRRSEVDEVTGLMRRKEFITLAQKGIQECASERTGAVIILLGIDDFANLSVKHSFFCAEDTVATLGRLIHSRFRAADLRCRWSDDSFALMFKDVEPDVAAKALARMLAEFSSLRFTGSDNEDFHATFSAGVAELGSDGSTIEAVLNVAYQRLLLNQRQRAGAIS
ncbi:MAG: GGDEF domain-containing response regulator, partial [Terriglobales bacterium]